jgi:hypothetical protein
MMITNFQYPFNELNRLIAAAVVDRDFCALLLTNPARAIGEGYQGERFQLSAETQAHLGSIRASSLPEFAQQLNTFPNVGNYAGKTKKFILNGRHSLTPQNGQIYDTSV